MKLTFRLLFFLLICNSLTAQSFDVVGELKKWHKVTIEFTGPSTSETATPNPFADYKLDVTFTNGVRSYSVPGYYAADGDAAETSATNGAIWNVHFTPDAIGTWTFTTTFYEGTDIAISGQPGIEGILHNVTGSFTIDDTDKTGRDLRGRGRLSYVDEHYLQFAEDSTWFFKAGADAPENTLAYEDIDDVPNRGNRRKSWQPHQQDYDAADASEYTWQNGKGTELLGVLNYLSTKGVNAFSFLTLSLHGDDENVFPHLLKVPVTTYNGYNDADQWSQGVHHDRFDVSRLAQWEKIYQYADKKGLYMHFKTMETENDNIMDNNGFDRERKLYYRELIARFSHHLALNWNLTEETTIPDAVAIATTNYISDIDPYNHNIVIHTYPGQQTQKYTPLLGNNSSLTGASIQIGKNDVHDEIVEWVEKSKMAGKKWIVSNDEQGSANIGVDADPNDNKLVRDEVLWGTLMGGGAGVEYYYGYQTNGTDLDAQDHRTRDSKYTDASYAIDYFDDHLQSYLPLLINNDGLTADNNDYVLTNSTNMVTVYRPDGGTTNITLDQSTTWIANWYNPRTGIMTYSNTPVTTSITAPDNNDWVALLTTECPPEGTLCDDGDSATMNDTITADCSCVGEACPIAGIPCDDNDPDTFDDVQDGDCNCAGIANIDIPGKVEAEEFHINNGTVPENCSDVGGGLNLGFITDGDNTSYKIEVISTGTYNITFRVASNRIGGNIAFSLDDQSGSVPVTNTGGWQTWVDVSIQRTFSNTGVFDLLLDYQGESGSLFNINYVRFDLINCNIGEACDDNNPNTSNDILDPNCICKGTAAIFASPLLEAEDANLGSEWTITSDTQACGSEYALPPNTAEYNTAPNLPKDHVNFTFNVDVAGTYKIYARTLTTSGAGDSFWVRANEGTWNSWNKINFGNYGNFYQWSQAGNWTSGDTATPVTFELVSGTNTVDFAWREPGARLDKIFITNEDLSVLNLVRNNDKEGEHSFKYIVEEACPSDTIRFESATDGTPVIVDNNMITIDKTLTIIGNGTTQTVLSGDELYQIFTNNSSSLSIHSLKMMNGYAPSNGGAFINDGSILLNNVELEGNKEGTTPKAFSSNGTVTISANSSVLIKE